MEAQRLFLFIIFTMSVFFLVDGWHRETQPQTQNRESVVAPKDSKGAIPVPVPSPSTTTTAHPAAPPTGGALVKGETVKVETDLLAAEIDTAGGDLRRLVLLAHRDTLDKSQLFTLFQQQGSHTYVAQAGLIGNGWPNHRTVYTPEAKELKLVPGADKVSVRLRASAGDSIGVTKVYTFYRGRYSVDVSFEIENRGDAAVETHAYFQLLRDGGAPAGDSAMLPTFTGAAVYTDKEKFQKVAFGDIDKNKQPYPKRSNDGWIAFIQHYFLAAWLPAPNVNREYYSQKLDNGLYAAGVIVPVSRIEPRSAGTLTVPLYAGPQEQEQLEKLAPGLDLTVDYGWLTFLAKPLFWLLNWLYQWVGNWGYAIIILTFIIKALFFPLSAAGYRSMARMGILAPKLQKLKEQYGDDRQRMNQAMMELYKTEKINPLGGCFPILIQIPVFIALYWVLLASVEMRHAPFMLWITDLSSPDPYYVLPVLMGATMIIQTYMNPEPPDPIQAKIMKIMPIAFSVFFFFFPAGLVLYWLVNNILSIAQQWQIKRSIGQAKPSHGK